MATYKITIRRTDYVKRVAGKEWAVINQAGERGYTPEIEKMISETVKVYQQTVDELDLVRVIAAVNRQ